MAAYFHLISVPNLKGGDAYEALAAKTHELSTLWRFPIPSKLKVGTLDVLMSLSDELLRVDTYVEGLTRRIANELRELAGGDVTLTVHGTNTDTYITHFQWEEAKFPVKVHLKDLVDRIATGVNKLDEEMRKKVVSYHGLTRDIASETKKEGGTLVSKTLRDIVTKEDFLESSYLTTLFVAVPRSSYKDWFASYETLTNFVLPRSSKLISEDNDYGLYSVVLFRRVADDFRNIAREKRFTVRDFSLEDVTGEFKVEKDKMLAEKERQQQRLIVWCKTNFGEVFAAWIHIKAIRVFVESILRYGLPINFQAILIQPNKRGDKKLLPLLWKEYEHLGRGYVVFNKDEVDDVVRGDKDKFYPFVFTNLDLEMQSHEY